MTNTEIAKAMQTHLDGPLPSMPAFRPGIRRAPDRGFRLSPGQTVVALKNALRYIPEQHHAALLPEFLDELRTRGRVYGYRFRPPGAITAKPVDAYRGDCLAGRAFQLMIDNNAFQCGFCAPAIVLAATELLDHNPNPTRHDVQEALAGNLCRCTGYEPIIEAILSVAESSEEHTGDR